MSRTSCRLALVLPLVLAGCADLPQSLRPGGSEAEEVGPARAADDRPTQRPTLQGPSATAASLDTVTDAEKDEARASAAASTGGELGTVTVSLGSPTDPGLWVKSALVTEDTPGTVRTGSGDAISVTLRPLGGAGGPQISLSALQALGLPLVGLHPVTLSAAG